MRQAIPPHSFARPNNALSFHTFIQAEVADGGFDFFDGQFDEALAALDRGTETAASTGESHYRAELYRLRGAVLAETREAAEAASWFQQAIDTARSQQAKSLELRAATSLARLRVGQGQRAEARNLLAPVYGWFTEGFDTADLKDAKALLDELA